ncbi:MAG: BTAD domain-containing putative transcriptional regulator [Chloroflexota bacterium]
MDAPPASQLVHHTSDPAFAIDQDLRVVAWNQGASTFLGYSEQDVLNQPCYSVICAVTPDSVPVCTPGCPGRNCFAEHRPFAIETCRCTRKDGTMVEVNLASMALPPAFRQGNAVAVVFLRPIKAPTAASARGALVRVLTLGRFAVHVGTSVVPVHTWSRKQSLSLFKYLLTCRDKHVHRDILIESFWPDASREAGRERLKVVVYFLRRALCAAGAPFDLVTRSGETYGVRRSDLWLDIDAFEDLTQKGNRLLAQGKTQEATRCLEDADVLYRGDYMADDLYADWCALERERLREIYLMALEKLANLQAEAGSCEKAVILCRKALSLEPCRESIHRSLMSYLHRAGRRDEAVAQFNACARILERELGVEPAPETRELFRMLTRR